MKVPDKIYIQTNKGEAFSSKWTTIPFRDFENTEYIRKDALLEWAKENQKDAGPFTTACYQVFVDKLNEM
jgi:hypothetical protein